MDQAHSPAQDHTGEGEGPDQLMKKDKALDLPTKVSGSAVHSYLVVGQLDPPCKVVLLPLSPQLQLIGVVPRHVAVVVSQFLVCGREG